MSLRKSQRLFLTCHFLQANAKTPQVEHQVISTQIHLQSCDIRSNI